MSPIISKIEKEFIFKFLIQNKVDIEIKCKEKTTYANILQQNNKELKIELQMIIDELLEKNAEITAFFYFQNNYHTFRSNVFKLQGNIAIIRNPVSIAKNMQRKFERVEIDGKYQLKFKIKGELVNLNFPKTQVHYYPNRPPIDVDFFDVKFEYIIAKFRQKISTYVTANKIKMFRNYTPATFEEALVIKYGKILYIPDITKDIPQKQITENINIILKSDWAKYEIDKNKTQAFMVNKSIINYLNELKKNDIFSQVIIPVLYRNYVTGLIYLINGYNNYKPISIKIIDYAQKFSRLLSYVLKENGYFKEEEKNTQGYIVPINDLSPGGLAIANQNNFFEDKLLLNHNMNFEIDIDNRTLKIYAKLVRKFHKNNKYFYGFMFIDIKREDHDFLAKLLYEEKNE